MQAHTQATITTSNKRIKQKFLLALNFGSFTHYVNFGMWHLTLLHLYLAHIPVVPHPSSRQCGQWREGTGGAQGTHNRPHDRLVWSPFSLDEVDYLFLWVITHDFLVPIGFRRPVTPDTRLLQHHPNSWCGHFWPFLWVITRYFWVPRGFQSHVSPDTRISRHCQNSWFRSFLVVSWVITHDFQVWEDFDDLWPSVHESSIIVKTHDFGHFWSFHGL